MNLPGKALEKTAQASTKLADSAETLSASAQDQTESADRRTVLAADRTVLASERTYAAWVRTGLAALAAGVGAKALLGEIHPAWMIKATGSLLILFSAFSFGAAVWREAIPGVPPPRPDLRKLPVWLLLTFNSLLIVAAFTALFGVWVR